MENIKFNIEKHIGVLSEGKGGWKKELNMVSWSDRPAKLDIRDWSPNHDKMGKGLTLTQDEALQLASLLAKIISEN